MNDRVHLKLDRSAASAVDAYFEYRNIVGEDDNGKLFTPEEYEEYKKTVLPMRMKNRLYVSWTNTAGIDCKIIGPETLCFCQHRYKQHQTDFPNASGIAQSSLKCKSRSCLCSGYDYFPKNGNQSLRCHCKHLSSDHGPQAPHACQTKSCLCQSFVTSFRCGCGDLASAHSLVIETRDERIKRGHPVAREEPPYAAMGGITGMSSLIDGYMRLDDSGIGAPTREFLEQPSSSYTMGPSAAPSSSGKSLTSKRKQLRQPQWNN